MSCLTYFSVIICLCYQLSDFVLFCPQLLMLLDSSPLAKAISTSVLGAWFIKIY